MNTNTENTIDQLDGLNADAIAKRDSYLAKSITATSDTDATAYATLASNAGNTAAAARTASILLSSGYSTDTVLNQIDAIIGYNPDEAGDLETIRQAIRS